LKDIYSAEKRILNALPGMAKAATHRDLKKAFENHLEHVEGLIEEATGTIREDMPENLLDAALIDAAQKVEHYEIAAYGTVRTFAKQLGMKEAVTLLQQTLDKESQSDKALTAIARHVNPAAQA